MASDTCAVADSHSRWRELSTIFSNMNEIFAQSCGSMRIRLGLGEFFDRESLFENLGIFQFDEARGAGVHTGEPVVQPAARLNIYTSRSGDQLAALKTSAHFRSTSLAQPRSDYCFASSAATRFSTSGERIGPCDHSPAIRPFASNVPW